MKILSSPTKEREVQQREPGSEPPFVNLSDITEIELLIVKRMREFTMGEHRSMFRGSGFDFVGLRDWAAGDRFSSIDWAQSSLTNFNPLIVREFEQPTTAGVVAVADGSLSTRCGVNGVRIGAVIARAVATIGMSAVFFQDTFGLIRFDAGFRQMAAVRPRTGKNHVIHCLDAYQYGRGLQTMRETDSLSMSISGLMRKTSLIPVISDFLFEPLPDVLRELAHLNSMHDVFLVVIDGSFAFEAPRLSAGWIQVFDVETGQSRVMSRSALTKLRQRVREWQDEVERTAKDNGLDVLRLGLDQAQSVATLTEFVVERRLRKG
jgi:uncharacterized protein (DUF58 family)